MHRRVEFISLAAEGLGELVRADAHTNRRSIELPDLGGLDVVVADPVAGVAAGKNPGGLVRQGRRLVAHRALALSSHGWPSERTVVATMSLALSSSTRAFDLSECAASAERRGDEPQRRDRVSAYHLCSPDYHLHPLQHHPGAVRHDGFSRRDGPNRVTIGRSVCPAAGSAGRVPYVRFRPLEHIPIAWNRRLSFDNIG